MKIKNITGHLKTVIIHKYFVGRYCFMCGLYWRGLTHDISKFSPTEFIESCRYFTGTYSPIDKCKAENGVSMAWLHHRGRNKHHWEMWVDNFEKGTTPIKMPFKYALEMICDFLGAGRAYNGKDFTMQSEWDWWLGKRKVAVLHQDTRDLVDILFCFMLEKGIKETLEDDVLLGHMGGVYKYAPEQLAKIKKYVLKRII